MVSHSFLNHQKSLSCIVIKIKKIQGYEPDDEDESYRIFVMENFEMNKKSKHTPNV